MTTSRRAFLQALGAAPLAGYSGASPVIGFAGGTYGMKTMKTQDALKATATIGYDGVELALMPTWPTDPAAMTATERKDLRRMLGDYGLVVPSMLESLPLTGPKVRTSNLERLKLAVALGNEIAPSLPPLVETILGLKTSEWDAVKGRMVEELKDWAKVAEDAKTTVCFKPHAAHAVNNTERANWLVKEVGSPRLRIVYDYSHFFVEGFPLESSLREVFPNVAYIAVKDSKGIPEKHDYLLPGDGTTNYLEYFRLLKELRYSHWVGVEVSAMVFRVPGYQPEPTLKLCYDRLAPVLKQAGIRRPARGHNHKES